jgi:selenocysteine lyase/cysteine desulfurase
MAHYQHERRTKLGKRQSVILISEAEYAANVVAACQWARSHAPSWTVLSIPSTELENGESTGVVDLAVLQKMLQGQYKSQKSEECIDEVLLDPEDIAIVCITHVPTNSGIVNPVAEIGSQVNRFNQQSTLTDEMPPIFYLVDACQSVGQMDVHADELRCHGLVATGRKFLRGPRGTGLLYVPRDTANQLIPHHMDHYGVPIARVPPKKTMARRLPVESMIDVRPKEGAARFEYYESSIANKLGLGEAVRYAKDHIGMGKIQASCLSLAQELYGRLTAMDRIQAYHAPGCGIVTFYAPDTPSEIIREKLWGGSPPHFETSLVPATSTPVDSSNTEAPNMVRISLTYTNSMEDTDALCKKLESILKRKAKL